MIILTKKPEKNRVEIFFSGENFFDFYTLMKKRKLKFDKFLKVWYGKPSKIYSLLDSLREIEDFRIPTDIYKYLEENAPKLETEFVRRAYNPDLLTYPPIKGKHPNENYQKEDIIKGIRQNRMFLAHEVGLGKTFISMGIINHHYAEKRIDKILILCKTEALYNWRRELLKFSNLFKEEDIIIASKDNRKPFNNKYKIVIMTYLTFVMISDDYYNLANPRKKGIKKYRNPPIPINEWGRNRLIIVDESQMIKNIKSRKSYIINLHKNFFDYRYCLSGTPSPNGIHELYPQINFLDAGIIQNSDYYDFLETICVLGTKRSEYDIADYKQDKVKEFLKRIDPWFIGRSTEKHLDLPESLIKNIYICMNKKQEEIYRAISSEFMEKLEQEKISFYKEKSLSDKKNKDKKFNELYKVTSSFPYLSLALDNPCILKNNKIYENPKIRKLLDNWNFEDHSKLEITNILLKQYIEDENRKVILWSGHPDTINSLVKYYHEYKPLFIHGQMDKFDEYKKMPSDKIKDNIIEKFKNSDCKLFIASYLAISTSVNIIECNRVIYFDRDYNLLSWLQSIGRVHRYGQEKTVIINPLILDKSLDIRQDKILNKKEDLNKLLLSRNSLTNEEWKRIFEGEDI